MRVLDWGSHNNKSGRVAGEKGHLLIMTLVTISCENGFLCTFYASRSA
jgi:hypothetical protein